MTGNTPLNERTSSSPSCHDVYHFILANKSRDHVLGEIVRNAVGRLLTIEVPTGVDNRVPYEDEALESLMKETLGISMKVTRKLFNGKNQRPEGADGVSINYLDVGHVGGDVGDGKGEGDEAKKPLEWIHRDVACKMGWVGKNGDGDKDHIAKEVRDVFNEMNGERRFAHSGEWDESEWVDELTVWSREMLERKEMVMEGSIWEVHSTFESKVMACKAKTKHGGGEEGKEECELIYIKCSFPVPCEVERTVAAAGLLGNVVPEILAVNKREGILMQRDGGKVTDGGFDQEALIETILEMQRVSMNRVSELEAGGLKIRDAEWMESNVESILKHQLLEDYCNDEEEEEDERRLRKEIIADLRSCIGEFKEKCQKIGKLGLPRTIVHGDLHIGNTGGPTGSERTVYRLFDWARAFIGNPLHDFGSLLSEPDPHFYGSDGMPVGSKNWEGAVKQVWKQWEGCIALTREEIPDVFNTLCGMVELVEIHDLTEQYHLYRGTAEKIRLFVWLKEILGNLEI